MRITIAWNHRVARLALLAVVSGVVQAGGAHQDSRNSIDPDRYRKLDGVWQCYFLKAKGKIEKNYYSVWAFEAAKKRVHIFWSPVHKGVLYDYDWNGERLVLDVGMYKTQMRTDATLIIEEPRFRWNGWRCMHQNGARWPEVRWPENGLQFLDYARYPWLSGLIEDGLAIMKYRDPKQYEEWLKGQPR